MLMRRVCGQPECSLGAIISFLTFLSLISNPNSTKMKWLREKEMDPGVQTMATVFHGGRTGGNTRDQVQKPDPKCSPRVRFCFPHVRDAHEAMREQICADPNVPIGAELTSHVH